MIPVASFFRYVMGAILVAACLAADTARAGQVVQVGSELMEVDVALVLAADVSQSMDEGRLKLQRDGYVGALASDEVIGAIRYGRNQRIAIAYFEWGSVDQQVLVAPWTIIDGPEAAKAFAARVRAAPSNSLQRTSISSAMKFASGLFDASRLKADRQVIDISGDGPNNQGPDLLTARDALLEQGVVINGLPILSPEAKTEWAPGVPKLDAYYEDCVIGGPGSFSVAAESMESFAQALRVKLVLEIAGIPQRDARIMPAAAAREPVNCRFFD